MRADDQVLVGSKANENSLDDAWFDRLFLRARTYFRWQARAVSPALLRRVYELARMGPTAANPVRRVSCS